MALAGHISRALMERYSHIRMEAERHAVDNLSGTDFESGVAEKWAQFFISDKSEEANLLKRSVGPGRTRTSNPLLKILLSVFGRSSHLAIPSLGRSCWPLCPSQPTGTRGSVLTRTQRPALSTDSYLDSIEMLLR